MSTTQESKIGVANTTLKQFCFRVTATHAIAYFIAGIATLITMNYEKQFSEGFLEYLMRPMNSPLVPLGAALQLINGFFMSLFLYPIRNEIIGNFKTGWKKLFILIIGFTIFAPQIPGPGNLEGLIYTKIPLAIHIMSFPETILYSLLFSLGVVSWYKYDRKWIKKTAVVLVILIILMSGLGYLDAVGLLPKQ